ncbi:unnamed protein product [Ambrosiozyma monospora]|uniref:Unnamed protein product n=1 Tax=Ambrosiozyma monospora TaxID=43982 RepID=A0A9W6Z357_AMBMO|nr:unnamed protein product [Ambrosiozyma monospora]
MSHPLVSMMNSMLQQLANILVCNQTIDGELNDLLTPTGLRSIPFHHLLYPAIDFTFAPQWTPNDANLNLLIANHSTGINISQIQRNLAYVTSSNANLENVSHYPPSSRVDDVTIITTIINHFSYPPLLAYIKAWFSIITSNSHISSSPQEYSPSTMNILLHSTPPAQSSDVS